jgi:hypothetical protein
LTLCDFGHLQFKNFIFQTQEVNKDDPNTNERLEHLEELSKVKILRTCQELSEHGITKSDLYFIDPDGELIGHPPIQVYCNFETGMTEVTHNSESMFKLEHCDTSGKQPHKISRRNSKKKIQQFFFKWDVQLWGFGSLF